MNLINLHGTTIVVDEIDGNLPVYFAPMTTIIITNPAIRASHPLLFSPFKVIEIGDGEEYKTLDTIKEIITRLLALGADRHTQIVGVGGGIVCDVTGFVASIYMRGCPFALVPTTLLAQVDAAIGGKNGVNYDGYKNIIGLISRPRTVLCDVAFLSTLPAREYNAGLSEIVKAAMISSAPFFGYIERHAEEILQRHPRVLRKLIARAIRTKANIVTIDEKEQGPRRLLNLGHTFAHAIEKHGALPHGEAVSVGICMAARVSLHLGMLTGEEYTRVVNLLAAFQLPTTVDIPVATLLEAIRADKKKAATEIHLILPEGIGKAVDHLLPYTEVDQLVTTTNSES
ncbi:MAG: 3-dehydroquinate synthase [Odoribacteraceae bacterium]|jgi:3-dehydroquinate synthase|nr:3-dehydroquinate synthase [Odoribacteraceae bacterium]